MTEKELERNERAETEKAHLERRGVDVSGQSIL